MTQQLHNELVAHLVRKDGQEDLCFAIWYPSQGNTRLTAVLHHALLPQQGDRQVHGNASFNPRFLERAIDAALSFRAGIAFLHSHPALGWQGMSEDDVLAEMTRLAPPVWGATELPVVGLTLAAQSGVWSARFWPRVAPRTFRRSWCATVRIVGEGLTVNYNDELLPPPTPRAAQARTISAWGADAHNHLARLRIGIVGLGSVGSLIAETLARTGVQWLELIDYQSIEEVNLDRTLHATPTHVRKHRSKVAVAAEAVRKSATSANFHVEPVEYSVCEDQGFRRALDCDLLFSCVDRPWARSVLNFIAYAHLIPVIDGGIRVTRTASGQLRGATWKAHIVGPEYRCMRCIGQYDPGLVESDRRGDLEDPAYLESLPTDDVSRANQNVFGFSLSVASLEFLQFIMYVVQPLGVSGGPPQTYHLLSGQTNLGLTQCDHDCPFPTLLGTAETKHPGTAQHIQAEQARLSRRKRSTPFAFLRTIIRR